MMFYLAAREGSFAMTAANLGLSPSAVSHSMRSLEEELGSALFRRNGPHVTLTGAGVRLLPIVEELMQCMKKIRQEMALLDSRSDQLKIALPQVLQSLMGSSMLGSFRECFPAALLEMGVPVSCEQKEHLVDFTIQYEAEVPAGVVRRDLIKETLHLYVAPFHPLGQHGRLKVEDFSDLWWILPEKGILETLKSTFLKGIHIEQRVWNLPDVRGAIDLATEGQGVLCLPDWCTSVHPVEPALIRLNPFLEAPTRTISAWWPAERPLSWIAEVFLSLLDGDLEKFR